MCCVYIGKFGNVCAYTYWVVLFLLTVFHIYNEKILLLAYSHMAEKKIINMNIILL